MKKICVAVFALLCAGTAFAQQANPKCKSMKTGTFTYAAEGLEHITIVRTANYQTETNAKTGGSISGKITWLSDCEYELYFDKITEKGAEGMLGQKIRTTITNVEGDIVSLHVIAEQGEGDVNMKKIKN